MKLRSVFVRGVGAVTPLGRTWPESVAKLAEGASAVAPVTHFDVRNFPCTAAAPLSGTRSGEAVPPASARYARCALRLPGPKMDVVRSAAREAWEAAAVEVSPEKIGVFLGAESGRASFSDVVALANAAGGGPRFDHRRFGRDARALAERIDASVVSPAAVTSALARDFGARGPAETVSLACASSAAAIAEGTRAIRIGQCDVAICGGVGADVDPLMLAGFGRLGALSTRGISRPFDVFRDGFVVGEGAAVIVLASERGRSTIEVAGEGRSLDAHHLTAPDPEGEGALRSMRAALHAAGLETVDYIQAHGTSTVLNDAVEAAAIRSLLGRALDRAHASSIKGALGHWVAGAGALGFLVAVEAVANGVLLPTAGLSTPDPSCELPHVIGRALRCEVETALVNSFAFGGANASLVVRRCA